MVGYLSGGFHHINKVDVGNIVQLPGAQLAHADDSEAALVGGWYLTFGNGQGPLQSRLGQIGQGPADTRLHLLGLLCSQVSCHNRSKLQPVLRAKGVDLASQDFLTRQSHACLTKGIGNEGLPRLEGTIT